MEKKSLIITFLYTLVLIFIQAISYISVDLEKPVFIVSNILFSLFVISKIFTLRKEKLFLLNPMFLACLKMFLFAYGLTIFYIYFEDVPLLDTIVVYSPYRYMNNIMIYASIAFISTWYSYHSTFIARIAERFFNFITRNKKILRKELTPKWILIYTIFILSIVFKLILISYGVYGVIGTILAETIEIPFLNVIVVLSSAGSGALLFLNFYYFKTGNKKYLFFIFFLIDFFFSILTGFKGAIVMSIIVVGIAYYCVYGKMKFVYILYCILAIKFAYIIINPYRIYMISNTDFEGTSLTGIIQGFIKSQENTYQTQEEETDNYAVVKRLNFIPEMTKFQEYKNERGFKEGDPDFIFYTLTTPIQLVTPRFLWKDKPKSDLGRIWVTQKVFNINYNTSTAFGPLGFLYMTGGVFAIIIGFILIGLVLKIVNLFLISDYWGGILIALALTLNVTSLEAEFNFYIITFIQTLIFAIIFQLVIFKKEINGS